MKKLNYDFLDCLKKMPPLQHSITGTDYDVRKSKAVQFMIRQPEIMQKIFNMAMNHKVIQYDPISGKWKGVDYEP